MSDRAYCHTVIVLAIVVTAIALFIFRGLTARERFSPSPVAADPMASAAPVPPVICTHEVCGDRPAFLQCIVHSTGYRETTCDRFAIGYERHCDCDAWAPNPALAEGGAK